MSESKEPWWKTVDPSTPMRDLIVKHQAQEPRIVPAWHVLARGLFTHEFSEIVRTEPEAEAVAEKALKDGYANVALSVLFGGTGRKEEHPTLFIQACYALETLEGLTMIGEPSFAFRVRLKDGGGLEMVRDEGKAEK